MGWRAICPRGRFVREGDLSWRASCHVIVLCSSKLNYCLLLWLGLTHKNHTWVLLVIFSCGLLPPCLPLKSKTCIWKKSVLLHTTQTTITSLLLLHTYMTSPLIFFASLNALQEGKTENIFASTNTFAYFLMGYLLWYVKRKGTIVFLPNTNAGGFLRQ